MKNLSKIFGLILTLTLFVAFAVKINANILSNFPIIDLSITNQLKINGNVYSGSTVKAGDIIDYTVNVTNIGDSVLPGVLDNPGLGRPSVRVIDKITIRNNGNVIYTDTVTSEIQNNIAVSQTRSINWQRTIPTNIPTDSVITIDTEASALVPEFVHLIPSTTYSINGGAYIDDNALKSATLNTGDKISFKFTVTNEGDVDQETVGAFGYLKVTTNGVVKYYYIGLYDLGTIAKGTSSEGIIPDFILPANHNNSKVEFIDYAVPSAADCEGEMREAKISRYASANMTVFNPVNPIVSKSVSDTNENGTNIKLDVRNETFKYDIKFNFGNTVSNWTKVVLYDDLEDILDVKSSNIVIKNKNNSIIDSSKYTINVSSDNKITITLATENAKFDYLKDEIYTVSVTTKIKDTVTNDQVIPFITNKIKNQASLQLNNDPSMKYDSNQTIVTPPNPNNPIVVKTVTDNNETGDKVTLDARNEVFKYEVKYNFGNEAGSYNKLVLRDDLEDILDVNVNNISIYDKYNNLVQAGRYIINIDTNTNLLTIELNKVNNSFSYLIDETYTVVINTKIKSTVTNSELLPYVNSKIINKAQLLINDDPSKTIESNPTIVTPPNPAEAKVIKMVTDSDEAGVDISLSKRNEPFYYTITYNFGTNGDNWTRVLLKDDLEDILTFTENDIVIKDKNNNVVNKNMYTVTISEKNEVEINLNPINYNYAYLMDEIYTVVINTKIKDSVSNEVIREYITKKIRNQAKLVTYNLNDPNNPNNPSNPNYDKDKDPSKDKNIKPSEEHNSNETLVTPPEPPILPKTGLSNVSLILLGSVTIVIGLIVVYRSIYTKRRYN